MPTPNYRKVLAAAEGHYDMVMAIFGDPIPGASTIMRPDGGASPVLVAVVRELEKKLGKARDTIKGGDATKVREAAIEVEQAADSAKAAAEADSGAKEETRAEIVAAHDRICRLKAGM